MAYTVIEMSLSTGERTGHEMVFGSPWPAGPLYTAKLKDGRACLGVTGLVIYPHGPHGDLVWLRPTPYTGKP